MALTTNKNFLSPVGFGFKIDTTQFPNLEYFCTAVNLPGVTTGDTAVPYRGVNLAMSGDRMGFEDLSIRFNITENMENYIETFDWMHNLIQKKDADKTYKNDATLLIYSSHNNVNQEIRFYDVFPIQLSSVEFNAQGTEIEYLQADLVLKYTSFEFASIQGETQTPPNTGGGQSGGGGGGY